MDEGMKANEAPEKLYYAPYGDIRENYPITDNDIEYTRTDAVIEKACNGIEKLLSGYIIRNFHFGDSYDIDRLIEDFKNYMKGE